MNMQRRFLADLEISEVLAGWRSMDESTRQSLLVLGSIVIVSLVVLLWAAFVRRPRSRRHSHHHHQSPPLADSYPGKAAVSGNGPPDSRLRRRHRHRPRNPTLAETGGLPPVRPPEPPEPPS
jgi:hypothetical protein